MQCVVPNTTPRRANPRHHTFSIAHTVSLSVSCTHMHILNVHAYMHIVCVPTVYAHIYMHEDTVCKSVNMYIYSVFLFSWPYVALEFYKEV